jgi:hypothetical protein
MLIVPLKTNILFYYSNVTSVKSDCHNLNGMVSFGVILAASFAALCASQPPGTPPPGTPPPGITPPPGVTLPPMPPASSTDYADEFPDECYVDWPDVDTCVQEDIYEDSSTRLLRSNAVPP